ncbi:MAG: hypothetical protein RSB64_07700, partial [Pseudomonas sp.]
RDFSVCTMVGVTQNIVGVSLLAIAVAHSKMMVADTPPSLASQLVCWYLKGGEGTKPDSDC